MQKNFKNDLGTKYSDIFRKLYVQWKLQSKKKYEELQSSGLVNSGGASKIIYVLMESLVDNTICDLQKLFDELPRKYNRKISFKELNAYKEKTMRNIEEHINSMEGELKSEYKNNLVFTAEYNEIFMNNLKENAKDKVEKLFDEINNFRKGKKVEGLVIFNIAFTALNFLIGIASLILEIINNG